MADRTEKLVKLIDGDTPSITLSVEQLGNWGALPIFIVAEDIDNPGTYVAVQGQYTAGGDFGLLTVAGGGDGLWDSSNTTWNQS